MRRKIEKFLAKKQGVDEANIRYTEDGRFDFMGDVEGVLSAVRGKDTLGKGKKSDRKSSRKSVKKGRRDDHKMHPIGMPMYLPYGMAPPYPGMPHPMYAHDGMMPPHMHHAYGKPMPSASSSKSSSTKVPLAPKPTSSAKTPMSYSPKKSKSTEAEKEESTPFISMNITPRQSSKRNTEPMSFSSSHKTMFDSPPKDNLDIGLGSPGALNIHGMTPLSTLKDTFATPYGTQMFSGLSPEDNLSLNKALFADDSKTPTAKSKSRRQMRFSLGNEESMSSFISDMRYNRVSISPLSCKTPKVAMETSPTLSEAPKSMEKASTPPSSTSRSIHFSDEVVVAEQSSASKANTFMTSVTSEAQTPRNVTQDSIDSRDIAAPSPFDASLTPIGNYDRGFWGNQLGFSPDDSSALTPFKSPGAAPLSMKKERKPLGTLSLNTIPKSESKREKMDIKTESEPTPKRQKTESVAGQ